MSRHDNARLFRDGVSRCCKEIATGIDCPLNACGVQGVCKNIPDGAFLCRWARRVDEGCEELDACFHANIVTLGSLVCRLGFASKLFGKKRSLSRDPVSFYGIDVRLDGRFSALARVIVEIHSTFKGIQLGGSVFLEAGFG
jgi:hypothetical protein